MSEAPSLERHLQLVPESAPRRRRVHVIRVSNQADGACSPEEQRERLELAAERDSVDVVATFYEPSVSGRKTPLHKRPGLLPAIEMVEADEADEVGVAYFDRLVRNIAIQQEIVERVQARGGRVLALDFGEVTTDTAARWLSASLLGVVHEYNGRSASERSQDSKVNAALRGVPPFPHIPPGYRKVGEGDARRIVLDETTADVMREAFRLRAGGHSFAEVRDFLAEHDVVRSTAAVRKLLANRWYLGELRWGKITNPDSHEPLVDLATFRDAAETQSTGGRKAKSEHLLARLGVLRCETCGGRMSLTATQWKGTRYPYYNCRSERCPKRAGIAAHIAEAIVWQATLDELERERLAGHASDEDRVAAAELELEKAEQAFRKTVRILDEFDDEEAAREELRALREQRDEAKAKRDKLLASSARRRTLPAGDAPLEAKRQLIRITIAGAFVRPGRGEDRIRIALVVE